MSTEITGAAIQPSFPIPSLRGGGQAEPCIRHSMQSKPAPNTTLINALPVEVLLLDGTKETVNLRQLSIRQLYRFAELAAADSTPEIVALCADKPVQWIDGLDLEAYGTLVQKCHELNFQRAVILVAKDPLIAARLLPLLLRLDAATKLLPSFGDSSKDQSPAPASSASMAETGSAVST